MKKILLVPMVMLLVSIAEPAAIACSQDTVDLMTGGACSIKELNNLEKNKRASENISVIPKRDKDLRPLKVSPKETNMDDNKCLLGTCLYKTLLGQ